MGDIHTYMLLFVVLAVASSLAAAGNAEGLKFLEENKGKPGVITLPSGLQYKVLRAGDGDSHPTPDSSCECHYEGRTAQSYPSGETFDSSYARGSPTSFAPNQVIKGWTEAMQLMVEGDKWEMYIPSDLAYGESGSPPKIPGGSALIFRMEIIKIKGGKVDAVTCDPATQEGCNEREKGFITKMKDAGAEKLKKELARLKKMSGGSMKPELQAWMMRRINVLAKMTKEL